MSTEDKMLVGCVIGMYILSLRISYLAGHSRGANKGYRDGRECMRGTLLQQIISLQEEVRWYRNFTTKFMQDTVEYFESLNNPWEEKTDE